MFTDLAAWTARLRHPGEMGRPSREERQSQKHTERVLKGIDKERRTRGATKATEVLKGVDAKQLLAASKKRVPPKKVNGDNIYSGSWRGFESEFASQWWANQSKPWTCCICKKPVVPGAKGRDEPTIEHRQPWATLKTEIDTKEVCCNGSHWEVALTKDVRKVLQDASNLAPAHKGCNSKKNGPKDTDSIAPQRRGDCPGPRCDLQKAT